MFNTNIKVVVVLAWIGVRGEGGVVQGWGRKAWLSCRRHARRIVLARNGSMIVSRMCGWRRITMVGRF